MTLLIKSVNLTNNQSKYWKKMINQNISLSWEKNMKRKLEMTHNIFHQAEKRKKMKDEKKKKRIKLWMLGLIWRESSISGDGEGMSLGRWEVMKLVVDKFVFI